MPGVLLLALLLCVVSACTKTYDPHFTFGGSPIPDRFWSSAYFWGLAALIAVGGMGPPRGIVMRPVLM